MYVSQDTLPILDSPSKPIHYGHGLIVKELDEKIIICADEKTRLRQGNFILEGKEIIVEAGAGVKISSRHPNVLIISADLTKIEEAMFDLKQETDKRLKVIEQVFGKILKQVKS